MNIFYITGLNIYSYTACQDPLHAGSRVHSAEYRRGTYSCSRPSITFSIISHSSDADSYFPWITFTFLFVFSIVGFLFIFGFSFIVGLILIFQLVLIFGVNFNVEVILIFDVLVIFEVFCILLNPTQYWTQYWNYMN